MRKTVLLILTLFLFNSCTNNNQDEIDCRLFDPVIQHLLVELVDENGINLLENGTFDKETIKIRLNSAEFQATKLDIFENSIAIQLLEQGAKTYEIVLSETETDTLVLDLSIREQICGFQFYNLDKAIYNGEAQTIIFENNSDPKIRVIK